MALMQTMINYVLQFRRIQVLSIKLLLFLFNLVIITRLVFPVQLFAQSSTVDSSGVDQIINRFLQVKDTHLHIENTTEWAFSGRIDSLVLEVMIQDSTHFRLFLQAQNMEILGYDSKLYTVNHGQRQIVIEPLKPHDLVKRFLGPLFTDVVLEEQKFERDGMRLRFGFRDPYSEWSSATVWAKNDWLVQQMVLEDVESNRVYVQLQYLNLMDGFYAEDILENSYGYRIADLTRQTTPSDQHEYR